MPLTIQELPQSQRIFYDQRWFGRGGIGRFAASLRERLVEQFGYELLDVRCGGTPCDWKDPLRLGRYLRRERATFYFSPGYNVPLGAGCPLVLTLHDIIHLSQHGNGSIGKRLYYNYLVRPAVRRSPLTLTVSRHSQNEIARFAGIDTSRIVVVGNGVDDAFVNHDFNAASNPATPYFLYVGCDKPHKNLPGLLRAFTKVAETRTIRLKLVTRATESLTKQVSQAGLMKSVDFMADVDEPALISLYQHAVATVMPSFVEGFGLPIIEAMACGCPVIASSTTATGEVVGNAGLTFMPSDTNALALAMIEIFDNPQTRSHLSRRGMIRASEFRWSEVAKRTHDALSSIGFGRSLRSKAA